MPRFIQVELDYGKIYINLADIHWIKRQGEVKNNWKLAYSLPGCPTTKEVVVSAEELARTYSLEEVAAQIKGSESDANL